MPSLLWLGHPRHLLLLVALHAFRTLSPAARQGATPRPAVYAVQATKSKMTILQLLVASAHRGRTRRTLEQGRAAPVHRTKPQSAVLVQSHRWHAGVPEDTHATVAVTALPAQLESTNPHAVTAPAWLAQQVRLLYCFRQPHGLMLACVTLASKRVLRVRACGHLPCRRLAPCVSPVLRIRTRTVRPPKYAQCAQQTRAQMVPSDLRTAELVSVILGSPEIS